MGSISVSLDSAGFHKQLHCRLRLALIYLRVKKEGSHSGLVRAPAKRLGGESSLMGSNPIPSAEKTLTTNI